MSLARPAQVKLRVMDGDYLKGTLQFTPPTYLHPTYSQFNITTFYNLSSQKMTITHIVMLKYPEGTSEAAIKQTLDDAIALKSTCIHPKTGKPYMISAKAGRDNSSEGIQNGFTHLFVMEFENAEDRDYYVAKDPVHQGYVKMLGALPIKEVMVMDFEGGCY